MAAIDGLKGSLVRADIDIATQIKTRFAISEAELASSVIYALIENLTQNRSHLVEKLLSVYGEVGSISKDYDAAHKIFGSYLDGESMVFPFLNEHLYKSF